MLEYGDKGSKAMSTDIPPEFESFVSSLIEQRRFLSEREVLSEGLRLLKAKESLAAEIQHGFDQIENGKLVDGPAAISKLRSSLEKRMQAGE